MDYFYRGCQMWHYKTPPQAVDLSDWDQEALKEIANTKISELQERLETVVDKHDFWNRIFKTLKIGTTDLQRQIFEYQFQTEKYYVELWLRYWQGFIQKPKVNPGQLKNEDIESAKRYPLNQLYSGQLRQVSGKYIGLCPFHEEKTPSFTIFPDNTYHCFGCQANGDSIDYLMKTKRLDFPQAVKELI